MALTCGGLFTKPCLGETDIRYDPQASNNLKDQAIIWSRYEGYYVYEQFFYRQDMQPYYFGSVSSNDPYIVVRYFPTIGFANRTVSGSRVYNHRYMIFPGLQNNNVSSIATAQDSWETSSYEKDGRSISRGGLLGFSTDATLLFDVAQSVNYVVDDRTLYGSGYTQGGLFTRDDIFMTETFTCLDADCTQMAVTQDQFEKTLFGTNHTVTSVLNMRKVPEEEWIDALHYSMDEYNVHNEYRVQVPMVGDCFTQVCNSILTEEWWCETDPNCSESPYLEPDAALQTGVVVGLVVAVFVVVLCFFCARYYCMLRRQEKHNRIVFARRIANMVTVGSSIHALSPKDLAAEFKAMEQTGASSGKICKERLKKFLRSSMAGRCQISDSDLEAFFTAIDLDSGELIDFIQFCGFLAHCEDELVGNNDGEDHHEWFAEESSGQLSTPSSGSIFDFGGDSLLSSSTVDTPAGTDKDIDSGYSLGNVQTSSTSIFEQVLSTSEIDGVGTEVVGV